LAGGAPVTAGVSIADQVDLWRCWGSWPGGRCGAAPGCLLVGRGVCRCGRRLVFCTTQCRGSTAVLRALRAQRRACLPHLVGAVMEGSRELDPPVSARHCRVALTETFAGAPSRLAGLVVLCLSFTSPISDCLVLQLADPSRCGKDWGARWSAGLVLSLRVHSRCRLGISDPNAAALGPSCFRHRPDALVAPLTPLNFRKRLIRFLSESTALTARLLTELSPEPHDSARPLQRPPADALLGCRALIAGLI